MQIIGNWLKITTYLVRNSKNPSPSKLSMRLLDKFSLVILAITRCKLESTLILLFYMFRTDSCGQSCR